MATTIGGLTTSTTSNIRGYGGLASGLDRDTLIEGMTYGTTSKITSQQKKKQQLEWKQSAVQNITNQMIAFANKFTSSWSSSSNLFSSVLWGRNKITTTGTNSKYVSITGNASSADAITIMGVKQLAEKAKWSSSGQVSDQTLKTGKIEVYDPYEIHHLIGKDIDFKVGGDEKATTGTLKLYREQRDADGNILKDDDGNDKLYDYSTKESALAAIKDQMSKQKVGDNAISSIADISLDADGKFVITGKGSNAVSITGGSAMSYLGFDSNKYSLNSEGITAEWEADIVEEVNFDKKIAGKKLTFSYNGKVKDIAMPGLEELENAKTPEEKIELIRKSMQDQMDSAFGKGRVKVGAENGALTFKTMDPSEKDKADTTSTLTLVSGNEDVKEVLGLGSGMSNRVNLGRKLVDAGLGLDADTFYKKDASGNVEKDADGNPILISKSIKIGDETIEITADDTVNSLMNKINKSGANISISYQSAADKFTITSKEDGASGSFNITSDDQEFLNKIFGTKVKNEDGTESYRAIEGTGKDAIVAMKYAGSDEIVELIRDTNSFTVDGLTVSVKGKFGYKDGEVITDDPDSVVGIDAQVNADSIVDAVKTMVEEYNAIIDLVNKELTTKPDREYGPLTSEQKKELSEDEIKLYEEKAKQGMLFADSDLRTLSSDLRFIIGGGIAQELSEMGISTSNSYSDSGKLTFDESKFRAALANDPERVQELFTSSSISNLSGNGTSQGIATVLKGVMDKYVNTMGSWESKGILVRKAGTESSPLSLTENYMYKQIVEYNKQIAKLQTLLQSERDRYIQQFTSLETLISQMNSQSSYLSQIGGY